MLQDSVTCLYFFFFFLYICNILWVTKKPPKILIAASNIAIKPTIFEISKLKLFSPAKDAIIAALATNNSSKIDISNLFGLAAIVLAAVNIFGGFLVTQRMLQMYKKKRKGKIK